MMMRLIVAATIALVMAAASSSTGAPTAGPFRPTRPGTSDDLRLQDFCVFRFGGYTYVASMKKDLCNQGILVARSRDLAKWEVLGDAVSARTPEDASMVWAPHVVEDKGTCYMFYTGVTTPKPGAWCQRILIATTTDPSRPANWKRSYAAEFIVDGKTQSWFRPSHKGAVWTDSGWADCRDPMILKHKGTWYMFYSATDSDGGIEGVATAPHPLGPWTDRGAVLKVQAGTVPESAFVLPAPGGSFVMTFNHAGGGGTKTARATSLLPTGDTPSFGDVRPISGTTGTTLGGWAHEFLPNKDGTLLCANLTGYFVSFKRAFFRKESYGWTIVEADTSAPKPG